MKTLTVFYLNSYSAARYGKYYFWICVQHNPTYTYTCCRWEFFVKMSFDRKESSKICVNILYSVTYMSYTYIYTYTCTYTYTSYRCTYTSYTCI